MTNCLGCNLRIITLCIILYNLIINLHYTVYTNIVVYLPLKFGMEQKSMHCLVMRSSWNYSDPKGLKLVLWCPMHTEVVQILVFFPCLPWSQRISKLGISGRFGCSVLPGVIFGLQKPQPFGDKNAVFHIQGLTRHSSRQLVLQTLQILRRWMFVQFRSLSFQQVGK